MSSDVFIPYVLTVLVLMSTPGPSHILMLSNSAANGMPRAYATAAGDLSANFLQMLAAGLGMSALIMAAPKAFLMLKIGGVFYLVWLGFKMIRASFAKTRAFQTGRRTKLRTLWLQGFITSATNPKAVIFFAALFPQFINPEIAFWPQFAVLSFSYLLIDGLFLCTYGFAADKLRKRLASDNAKWIDRLGGFGVLIAAMLLGFKSIPRP